MKKLFSKVKFILEKESQNWDVTVISPGMQRKFLNLTDSLEKQHERKVFTIIGHPKCLKSTDTLQELLKGANQPSACNFSTVTDFYRTEIAHQNKDH